MMTIAMIIAALAGASQVEAAEGATEVTISAKFGQTEARSMLQLVNDFRTGNETWYWDEDDSEKIQCGPLMQLEYDYTLEKIAMHRALEIALCYGAERASGESLREAYEEYGYPVDPIGENIAAGQTSARAAFQAWVESKSDYDGQADRRNMLSENFSAIGIGHVYYDNTHYWVQVFGDPVNGDLEKTEADDKTANHTVAVAKSKINDMTVSPNSLRMETGSGKDLSGLLIYLNLEDHYSVRNKYACAVVADFDLDSSDYDILSINDKKIKAEKTGEVTLTISAMGMSCEVPVVVTKRVEYTVTYDANGGTCNTEKTLTTGKTLGSLPVPVRNGYEFTGWFTGREDSASAVTTSRVYSDDTTIYAHWREKSSASDNPSGSEETSGTDNAQTDDDRNKITLPVPGKPTVSSQKTGKVKVTWGSEKNVSGYQICYSASSGFKKSQIIEIKKAAKTSLTIGNLKSGKKIYVRVRTYKKVNGAFIYGKWSKKASQKVK